MRPAASHPARYCASSPPVRGRTNSLRLRKVGRIERTLFMIDWILDADLQRRTQIGLNKGEAHHTVVVGLPENP